MTISLSIDSIPSSRFRFVVLAMAAGLAATTIGCGSKKKVAPKTPTATFSDYAVMLKLKEGGDSESKRFTILNSGQGILEVDEVKYDGPLAVTVRVNPVAPFALMPKESATVTVKLRPDEPKKYEGKITVTTNDPKFPSVEVAVEAEIVAAPVCRTDNPCMRATINEESGRCEITPRSSSCDDNQKCTKNDRCIEGTCIGVPTESCYGAGACIPGECDDAVIPPSLLGKNGQLRPDWKEIVKRN